MHNKKWNYQSIVFTCAYMTFQSNSGKAVFSLGKQALSTLDFRFRHQRSKRLTNREIVVVINVFSGCPQAESHIWGDNFVWRQASVTNEQTWSPHDNQCFLIIRCICLKLRRTLLCPFPHLQREHNTIVLWSSLWLTEEYYYKNTGIIGNLLYLFCI